MLLDPGGAPGDLFGRAVAVSGNGGTVLVGAPGARISSGAVYAYGRCGRWTGL